MALSDINPNVDPVAAGAAGAPAGTPIASTPVVPAATTSAAQPTQESQPVSVPMSSIAGTTTPAPPSVSDLAPGSQGQDVSQLQDYLVQMGYLTSDQVGSGEGTYGPQTTAAVAKLQKDLGINAGTAAGSYGPQTQAAIAQKYKNAFANVQSTQAPTTGGGASTQLQSVLQTQSTQSTDPVFGALTSSLAPIMQSLGQVLQNINNPALTSVSLQSEYNTLAQQYNIPGMQSQLLNYQNIMNGTTDDIRNEITSAGGSATESQVLAMSSARNTTILKQYNALSTQFTAAQTNVQNMMQYASTDQQTELQRDQATASVTESMASIESQAISMGNTMQQNALSAVQYNVTQTGYAGLANSAQGNPQMLSYYEQLLNLSPGTLSNPQSIASLDTYKQQQLAISQEAAQNAANRTVIYAGAQGIALPGSTPTIPSTGTVTANGSVAAPIDPNSLTRPTWLSTNVPLSMSSTDAQQYLSSAKGAVTGGTAGSNAYGNNFTVPGVGNYVAQPDGSYILQSALPPAPTASVPQLISDITTVGSQVPQMNYTDIKNVEANAPASTLAPASTAFHREELSAKGLVSNYISSPVYTTVSSAPLPFARIQAAQNGNNSISDTELLDSYITLAKGQGQITEAQISAITNASSMSDKLNIISQKVAGAGALISSDQRKSLLSLSGNVFDQYANTYQTLYTGAINTLAQSHVDPSFWGVVPDFSTMIQGADLSSTQLFSNQ